MIEALEAPNLDSKKRGRPSEISNEALFSRRNTLLGIFEYHWSEIAWELQRAKSLAAIREALGPLPIPRSYEFELFLFEPTKETTFKELRDLSKARRGLGIEFKKALLVEGDAEEARENVEGAMKDRSSDATTESALHKYQRLYSAAKRRKEELQVRIDVMENDLRRQRAFIAQTGLLDFIRSERYTLSPMSYANAMAGLPFITWRQSVSRCLKAKASHPFLNIYELFLEVQRALNGPPQTAELAMEQAKLHLKKSKQKREYSIQILREEWYYLRVAIEAAYSQKPPRSAIPFRVFAEYRRRTSCRSQLDQFMAKEECL